MPGPRFIDLTVAAQASYAELTERTRDVEMDQALSGLPGAFHMLDRKGTGYWYYSYRDPGDRRSKVVYVGPDTEAVRALVARSRAPGGGDTLPGSARAAVELGCASLVPKHFRIVKRLSEYGLFRGGGVLIGTHAFLVLGNSLGVKWRDGTGTLDVDIAHAGHNVSVALPARLNVNVHGALESLELGLLPIAELDGSIGSRYRSADDETLRVDFVTPFMRPGKPVRIAELNVVLEPLRFMEFLLEGSTQGCALGRSGSCIVNLPSAERLAVHKLLVYGERSGASRAKAPKDLLQAAALAAYFAAREPAPFNAAWNDLLSRGPGWKRRAINGQAALLRIAPDLSIPELWRA